MPDNRIRRVSLTCARCEFTFEVQAYRATSARYCSKACTDGPPVTVICSGCGESFRLSLAQATRRNRAFCSMKCRYPGTFEERFWVQVDKNGPIPDPAIYPGLGECWIWKGARDRFGYGRYKHRLAHRVAYALTHGQDPPADAPIAAHLCDNGYLGCVRPSHLMADTQVGNVRQAVERGRMASGDRNGSRTHPERHWSRRRKCEAD
jgi:hypothetical protein